LASQPAAAGVVVAQSLPGKTEAGCWADAASVIARAAAKTKARDMAL